MVKSSVAAFVILCGIALGVSFWDQIIDSWTKTPFEIHGHQGSYGTTPPGNTLPSYRKGAAQGATVIEGDLQLTQDGHPVAGHDATLRRECQVAVNQALPSRRFDQLTRRQIAAVDCHPELIGIQSPPLLDSILAFALEVDVSLNLELKPQGEPIARIVSEIITRKNDACSGCYEGRLTIQSFHAEQLKLLDQLSKSGAFRPRLSFLSQGTSTAELEGSQPYVEVYSPNAKHLDPQAIRKLTRDGFLVIPWTVNDRREMCELARQGVHGLITDYPARLRPLAERMNQSRRTPENCNEFLPKP